MKLLQFIHHTSAGLFYFALVVSIASGLANALLASLIGQIITGGEGLTGGFISFFALLMFLVLLFDFGAKQTTNLLANKMHYELRLSFTRQVLTSSFSRLEMVGNPRLLALLTEDSQLIGQVITVLPTVAIGLATMLGCSLYLIWLAPATFGAMILIALPLFFHK